MCLLELLFGIDNSKDEKKKRELEKQMNLFGLTDSEKKEVRKGNYNPWNFEEEDLEEDDYYYDDSE